MNKNYKVWKLSKIIKVIMKLRLEGSICFEVEWFVDDHNLFRIFFEILKKIKF